MHGNFVSFMVGLIFALGLGISGMMMPAKVIGFLDITGAWDLSLALVMVGAIGVHAVLYRLIRHRMSPILGGKFQIPTRKDLDWRLLTGAALFGVGWGVGGFCPGPALASAAGGAPIVLAFVASMIGGMWLFNVWSAWATARAAQPNTPTTPTTSSTPTPSHSA
jgi:uncharacterized membrane protein YedE/YeeE